MKFSIANPVGVNKLQQDQVFLGYTLLTTTLSSRVILVNLRGEVVHAWNTPRPVFYGYLLDNGNLLCGMVTEENVGPSSGRTGSVAELDWDGRVVWEYRRPGLHHDHCRMSNGNTMVLGYEAVPPGIAARVKGGLPGASADGEMWSDYFLEVTPDGRLAWEWHAYDVFDPDEYPTCFLCGRHEWTHANTCEGLPDGNLLTSFRRLNMVGIIDKSSGRFSWQWGRADLGHQHDPTLLDNGNVLIFDNGFHGPSEYPSSRVIEVDPSKNEIVWEYKSSPPWDFFSGHISGAQRLPNGNTLICQGAQGRIFEVTAPGEVVWEYRNPYFQRHPVMGHVINSVFRAHRYGPDFSGFRGKVLDASRWSALNSLL